MALAPTSTLATRAQAIVREHVLLSAGAALIPEAVLCTTSITGAHIRMLSELSKLYGVPFSPKTGKALLIAAGAGLLTDGLLGMPLAKRAIAALAPVIIPVWFLGGAIIAGTFSHLLGHAFIRHYERGGTFADFDWHEFRREITDKIKERVSISTLTAPYPSGS